MIKLIRTLAEGTPVARGDLSAEMLKEIEELGLTLRLENGHFSLEEPLELLCEDSICTQIDTSSSVLLNKLDIHWSIGSTNDYLLSRMHSKEAHGQACLAEQQVSGKGRRGRKWISPFGRNLYMSIGWMMPRDTQGISALSLVVGIEVAEVLREFGLQQVNLKWPNDLLMDGGKLGGILIEMTLSASHHGLVIGMGINFESGVPDQAQVGQPVGSIPLASGIGRNQLAGKLLNRILPALDGFAETGFLPYRHRWAGLNLFQNQEVSIHSGDLIIKGIDRGIDEDGNLILDRGGELVNFNSGEVSLRATSHA